MTAHYKKCQKCKSKTKHDDTGWRGDKRSEIVDGSTKYFQTMIIACKKCGARQILKAEITKQSFEAGMKNPTKDKVK